MIFRKAQGAACRGSKSRMRLACRSLAPPGLLHPHLGEAKPKKEVNEASLACV